MLRTTTALSLGLIALAAPALADTTLRYMMWDPSQLEIEAPVIAAFEAANPGVTVDIQAMPPKDYWPKLSAMAAAGDLPDVFAMSSGFVLDWAQAGNLANLDPIVEGSDLSVYFEGALAPGMVDGSMYAFPQNWVAPVLYYNMDMFDAAGLAYPTADWGWEDVRSAAKALTLDANNDGTPEQYGMWLYGRYAHIDGWVYRNGGRYLNAAGDRMELNPQAVNALSFLNDLVNTDRVAPAPQEMEGIRQQDVFPLGMAAMWVDGSWNIAGVRSTADAAMRWGIAPIPAGPDATPETSAHYAWADMLSIGANTAQGDLAWKFIQHMTGGARSASDFLGGKVPAYRAIAESEAWQDRGMMPVNKDVILQIGAEPIYSGFGKSWSAWRGYAAEGAGGMNGELDEAFNGRKPIDQAITDFTAYANDILSR